jgi:hypothetical protein
MWQCEHCGEAVENDWQVCWNCSRERADVERGGGPGSNNSDPTDARPAGNNCRADDALADASQANDSEPSGELHKPIDKDASDGRLMRPVGIVQFLVGVALPFICLAISLPDQPDWQSGRASDYAKLLLSHSGLAPIYPFLLYCMACMTMLFIKPDKFREFAWVRFGIYSGVVVAAEYWLLFDIAMSPRPTYWLSLLSVLVVILPWPLWSLLGFLFGKRRGEIVFALGIVGLMLGCVIAPGGFGVIIIGCLACSTPLAFSAYLITSIYLIRHEQDRFRFTLAQLLAIVTWFAAHCAAWRMSYTIMLYEYAQLPKNEPDRCFVCSAAAKGHSSFVGSEDYVTGSGARFRVTDQLRVLKAFELLLLKITPYGHNTLRQVYNRVGPSITAILIHPVLADLAYLAIKPAEWLALGCLSLALGNKWLAIYSLYNSDMNTKR